MIKCQRQRLSRFKRPRNPKGIALQPRDIGIILAVYQYRYLTRELIQRRFHIPCVTRVNLILRRLYNHHLLDRRFRPTVTGSSQAVYFLGPRAVPIVAEKLLLDAEIINRHRRASFAAREESLNHDMMVNETRVRIMCELEQRSQYRVNKWLDPRDCECHFEIGQQGHSVEYFLRPDGFFTIQHGNEILAFFIEIDLATSGIKKLIRKYMAYSVYLQKGVFNRIFGLNNFNVLTLTKSSKRAANLANACRPLGNNFLFSTSSRDNSPGILFVPLWHKSGDTDISRLHTAIDKGDRR